MMDFVFKMMNFALKRSDPRDAVAQVFDYKSMNFVFKLINFVFKLVNFVSALS